MNDHRRSLVSAAAGAAALALLCGRAAAQVFLGHLPGATDSEANAVSADGLVVVGTSWPPARAFRWTAAGGMVDLGVFPGQTESHATATSADGQVVVGWCGNPGQARPFRWTAGTGMVPLFEPAGCSVPGSLGYRAFGVSADGSVIVGDADPCEGAAFRWTSSSGLQLLPRLLCGLDHARGVTPDGSLAFGWSSGARRPACSGAAGAQGALWPAPGGVFGIGAAPGEGPSAFVMAASADGSVLVGGVGDPAGSSTNAARWTASTGWVEFLPAGSTSRALGVSADGSVIVGQTRNAFCPSTAFVRDAAGSVTYLGEHFTEARAVSADGLVVAGVGWRQYGQAQEGWVMRRESPSCYANCDHSTATPFLNVADFTCFLQHVAAGDGYGFCDGGCNYWQVIGQFTCFLQKFAAGCTAP